MNLREFGQRFEARFGDRPRVFRAPGRVNLIGEHTDYNDGFVMPAAVGFSTHVGISPRSDGKLLVHSDEFPGNFEFEVHRLPERRTGEWCDYILGVASVLRERDCLPSGANLLVHGEVPIGAGLSSSAAIEVASALALLSLGNNQLSLPEIAKLCRCAENEFVGARVGIMDQFVSCMGKAEHAVLLDCRSLEFKFVPIPPRIRLVVCNTMVKHEHSGGEYNDRRAQCEEGVRLLKQRFPSIKALRDVSPAQLESHRGDLPELIYRRCRHIVTENARVVRTAEALQKGDLRAVGECMAESHMSMRDDYEISCRELDIMVDLANGREGLIGARMTGGGFGGCTINLVRIDAVEQFKTAMLSGYHHATGISSDIYVSNAGAGITEISANG